MSLKMTSFEVAEVTNPTKSRMPDNFYFMQFFAQMPLYATFIENELKWPQMTSKMTSIEVGEVTNPTKSRMPDNFYFMHFFDKTSLSASFSTLVILKKNYNKKITSNS